MLQANRLQNDRQKREHHKKILRVKRDKGGEEKDKPSSDQGNVARFPGPGEEGVDEATTVDVAVDVGEEDQDAEKGEGGLWEGEEGREGG